MTQRDWQKDWDRATMFDHMEFVINNPRPFLGVTNYESPLIPLKYWLQEAKRLQESLNISHMAYEGMQEDNVSRGEYASLLGKLTTMTVARNTEKGRAEVAEARVKELESIIKAANDENDWLISGDADEVYGEAMSTLYPDTPALKEGTEQ